MSDPDAGPRIERERIWVEYYRDVFFAGVPWLDYSNERVQIQTYAAALDAGGAVQDRRCLDVGCGRGQFARALHGLGASDVTGFDVVPELVEQNAVVAPAIRWLCGSAQDPAFMARLDQYDLVFLIELLQYLPLVPTLEALWPHVAPGGRVVAIMPNADCPIITHTRSRFGTGYEPPTRNEIATALRALPDVGRWAIRGMFFCRDQTITPYELSAWDTQVNSTVPAPNRLQFVVLKRGPLAE